METVTLDITFYASRSRDARPSRRALVDFVRTARTHPLVEIRSTGGNRPSARIVAPTMLADGICRHARVFGECQRVETIILRGDS